jgi:hypothetical protein
MKNKLFLTLGLCSGLLLFSGCTKEEADPSVQRLDSVTLGLTGEWKGVDLVVLNANGTTTTNPLTDVISLRTEAGKDTFNIRNAAGQVTRSGTWSVVEVQGPHPANRVLRLGTRAANRMNYLTFVLQEASGNNLVLLDNYEDNGRRHRTLRYGK